MDETVHFRQLTLDVTPSTVEAACHQADSVPIAIRGRVIDDEAIRQAVQRAERRLAEQSLRQARRLAQVNLWRSAG